MFFFHDFFLSVLFFFFVMEGMCVLISFILPNLVLINQVVLDAWYIPHSYFKDPPDSPQYLNCGMALSLLKHYYLYVLPRIHPPAHLFIPQTWLALCWMLGSHEKIGNYYEANKVTDHSIERYN